MNAITNYLRSAFGQVAFSFVPTGGEASDRIRLLLNKKVVGFNSFAVHKGPIVFVAEDGAFTPDQTILGGLFYDEDTNELVITTSGLDDGDQFRIGGADALPATVADSAASTGSSEVVFSNGSLSIPAGTLAAGSVYEFYARVRRVLVNSTDTQRVRVRLGGTTLTGTVLADGGALATVANDILEVRGQFTIRTAGASGTMVGQSKVEGLILASPAETVVRLNLASTAIDTTAALLFEVTSLMSSANAGNTSVLQSLWLRKVK